MNKQLLLAMLLVLTVVLSAGTIYASEVNVTDSYATNLVDDTSDASVPLENTADSSEISVSNDSNVDNDPSKVSLSSEEVLESEDSNTLSTDTNDDSMVAGGAAAKTSTQLVSPTSSMYYKGYFSITLKDANGKALVGKTVDFVINGVKTSGVTDNNGVASVQVSSNPGKYTASASFAGDDGYGASDVSSTVNILATVKSKDITKYYKATTQYSATFLTSQGKALANMNVQITVNGKTYTKKTNANGVAYLPIDLTPGSYKVVATDPITGYKQTNTFKILSTINANDVTKVYTDGKRFYATFLKSNGKALSNQVVKFKINGKTYSVKTNAKGVASLSMTNLKTGTYKMISYNRDGLTKTNTVKVVRSTTSSLTTYTYTFLKSDTKYIKAKLLNGLGYAPGAGKVIKFTINGKTYSAKTNANGIASIKLPSLNAGAYTVKYSFAGNSFYKASSASNKVYILPTKASTFTVKSTTTFGYGANTPFKVALTSGSVALVGKTVTLTLNGKSYTKTTDSNGVVSLPIDLAIGKYSVSYSFKGDSKSNAKTGSSSITVKERAKTTVTWKSGSSFYQGNQNYKVLLQNSAGKALSGKVLKLTVNSKTYSATTASNGYATFSVNVAPGNYTVSFNYPASGDNDNAPSSGSAKVSVEKKNTVGNGYWLYASDMNSVNLKTLASQGTTDIFLNFAAVNKDGFTSFITNANSAGIRVHIWMQAFYQGGVWSNPVKNGKIDETLFNKKIAEAVSYAKIKGVSGVHIDYIRYSGVEKTNNAAYQTPGGTQAISTFAQQITEAVHDVNSNLIVSCSLMPETTSGAYYYGQDYSVLSQYMDVVIPMIYKGNYGKTSAWITTTTKWYVDNSAGAQVWVGLQGYKSDSNVVSLSASELAGDAQSALNGKASGVIIFRIGNSNLINFNSLSDQSASPTTTGSVSIADIVNAAYNLNNTIGSGGNIPSTVTVGGVSYSTSQFLYMMTKAVEYINSGKTSQILPVSAGVPSNPSSTAKAGVLYTSEYVDLAKRVSNFIVNNGLAPNYANSSLGYIKYQSLVDAFTRILAFYKSHNRLPDYANINVGATSAATGSASASKTISIKNIVIGASNLKTYYEKNKVMPSTVTAGGITFTLPEFLYLMSQAIYQIGNSNSKDITVVSGVSAPGSPYGDNIASKDLYKSNYLTVAKNVVNYITTNKRAPNYASSAVGNIIYSEVVDSFSRILAFYGSNGDLPNYVTISYSSSSAVSGGSSSSSSGSGLNEKCTETDLAKYLKATTNCEVGNSKIKTLVNSLTKGLTSDLDKAKAIFNYVRDTLSYSFYYNTKYGAVGTLNAGKGNCVDHSHLLVAMFRTAGLEARYVHGTCTFSSGSTYGHVWTQVLVNGKWYVADATSSKNSLGSISNWKTSSFTLNGIYSSLSF